MPQMFLPGMPDGAIRINPAVSHLSKEGRVTWFVGDDNYFSHPAQDTSGHRLALATLMENGYAKPCQITATLGTPRSSLMRWRRQLEERGAGSFYQPRVVRGGTAMHIPCVLGFMALASTVSNIGVKNLVWRCF